MPRRKTSRDRRWRKVKHFVQKRRRDLALASKVPEHGDDSLDESADPGLHLVNPSMIKTEVEEDADTTMNSLEKDDMKTNTNSTFVKLEEVESWTEYADHDSPEIQSSSSSDYYSCNICSKTFSSPVALSMHQRSHLGEKPIFEAECEICRRTFTRRDTYTRHRRNHGDNPFKCELCNKIFSSKASLTEHNRRHSGDMPFSCQFCSKSFSAKSALNVHTRIHTGEKPFSCKYCGKTFSDKKACSTHLRVHTGEKPYECGVCKKAFTQRTSLNKHHRRMHSGEKP